VDNAPADAVPMGLWILCCYAILTAAVDKKYSALYLVLIIKGFVWGGLPGWDFPNKVIIPHLNTLYLWA
jgi:hypothetical protein